MRSFASLAALLLLPAAAPAVTVQEPPPGDGPRGSSQEARYDAVGYAAIGTLEGVSAASTALAPGDFAEITAIENGRTIVVAIEAGEVATDRVVTLSPAAAAALGAVKEPVAVRVRKVTVSPQDVALLHSGAAASSRADAPPLLLTALRRKLAAIPPAAGAEVPQAAARPARTGARPDATPAPRRTPTAAPAPRPTPTPRPTPVAGTRGAGYYVQVAALSDRARANALAASVGGFVAPSAGAPYRVRIGPFADRARAAAAARDRAGAQVLRLP